MKTIKLSSVSIKKIFQELHLTLGGTLSLNVKEHILDLDNEFGKGQIRGITFKAGISYLEFDVIFSKDFALHTMTPETAPICFAYCSHGEVAHRFVSKKEVNTLENFQTGILTNAPFEENILYFTKNIRIKTTLIIVKTSFDTTTQKKKSLSYRLQELLFKDTSSENLLYVGSYNLKIADKIQELAAIKQQGIVRSLLIEGLVHTILGLEIQQHTDDFNKIEGCNGSLASNEMDMISEVSQFINNYPERQSSINDLCRKSGLSPSKLQIGFKLMHGTTVSDYIRDVRIQKAEELIKTTDLNISEVVYSIGLTSRSYFSKIFKQKYDCSPKQYKDKQRSYGASA